MLFLDWPTKNFLLVPLFLDNIPGVIWGADSENVIELTTPVLASQIRLPLQKELFCVLINQIIYFLKLHSL